MGGQCLGDFFQGSQTARLEFTPGKVRFHASADGAPIITADTGFNAPIGDDFHPPIEHLDVDQYATVVFGIPHALVRERVQGAFAAWRIAPQVTQGQSGVKNKTQFPKMPPFRLRNGAFDGLHGAFRQSPANPPVGQQ